jgi:hypothetical protein
MNMKPIPAFS